MWNILKAAGFRLTREGINAIITIVKIHGKSGFCRIIGYPSKQNFIFTEGKMAKGQISPAKHKAGGLLIAIAVLGVAAVIGIILWLAHSQSDDYLINSLSPAEYLAKTEEKNASAFRNSFLEKYKSVSESLTAVETEEGKIKYAVFDADVSLKSELLSIINSTKSKIKTTDYKINVKSATQNDILKSDVNLSSATGKLAAEFFIAPDGKNSALYINFNDIIDKYVLATGSGISFPSFKPSFVSEEEAEAGFDAIVGIWTASFAEYADDISLTKNKKVSGKDGEEIRNIVEMELDEEKTVAFLDTVLSAVGSSDSAVALLGIKAAEMNDFIAELKSELADKPVRLSMTTYYNKGIITNRTFSLSRDGGESALAGFELSGENSVKLDFSYTADGATTSVALENTAVDGKNTGTCTVLVSDESQTSTYALNYTDLSVDEAGIFAGTLDLDRKTEYTDTLKNSFDDEAVFVLSNSENRQAISLTSPYATAEILIYSEDGEMFSLPDESKVDGSLTFSFAELGRFVDALNGLFGVK